MQTFAEYPMAEHYFNYIVKQSVDLLVYLIIYSLHCKSSMHWWHTAANLRYHGNSPHAVCMYILHNSAVIMDL